MSREKAFRNFAVLSLITVLPGYVYLRAMLFMVSLSGPCVPDDNYGIPGVVYEAILLALTVIGLLLIGNLYLAGMLRSERKCPLWLWMLAVIANILVATAILDFDFETEMFWCLSYFRKQMPGENLIWKSPRLLAELAGGIAMTSALCVLGCFLKRKLFTGNWKNHGFQN